MKHIEKQSLREHLDEALKMSNDHPEMTYYVMDRKRYSAVITAVDWIRRQRILDGYRTQFVCKAGQIVADYYS